MTTTTKVEGRTYADLSFWGKRFDKKAMKQLAGYLSSYNMGVSQALAFAAADPATTGTKPIMINGTYINALTVEDDADWSDADTASTLVAGDARGTALTNGKSVYCVCFARSTGLLRIDLSSSGVADDADATLKIPQWDASVWAPIATFDVNAGGAVTLGTTDISGIVTIVQQLSPLLPHPDNLDLN